MNIPADAATLPRTPTEAVELQRRLAGQIRLIPCRLENIRLVCGCDVSYFRAEGRMRAKAAVVVWDLSAGAMVEVRQALAEVIFPYIPGLLSFREIPPLLEVMRQLDHHPDLLLVDGQGIAHPRSLGLASHLGLVLDVPAIGAAKSRLIGDYEDPGIDKGDFSSLMILGEQRGIVLRTRSGTKPLFVSPGHRMDCESARILTLACCGRYRIPEPSRLAHHYTRSVEI